MYIINTTCIIPTTTANLAWHSNKFTISKYAKATLTELSIDEDIKQFFGDFVEKQILELFVDKKSYWLYECVVWCNKLIVYRNGVVILQTNVYNTDEIGEWQWQ